MSDDQFAKLFRYMQHMEMRMQTEFDRVHEEIRDIYGHLEAIAKRNEDEDQERLIIIKQLGTHDVWIREMAAKLELRLADR